MRHQIKYQLMLCMFIPKVLHGHVVANREKELMCEVSPLSDAKMVKGSAESPDKK